MSITAAIAAELGDDVDMDALVTLPRIAALFGVKYETVYHAMRLGRLPVERRPWGDRVVWVARPADAIRLWGYRLVTAALEAESAVHTAAAKSA